MEFEELARGCPWKGSYCNANTEYHPLCREDNCGLWYVRGTLAQDTITTPWFDGITHYYSSGGRLFEHTSDGWTDITEGK